MAGRLDGKVCVITGAGGGMGREAAIVFTGEGARVCVADLDLALAEETVSMCSGDAFAFGVNVADEDGVRAMYAATAERFGGIDVLCNVAGGFRMGEAVHETSAETWCFLFDINAHTVLNAVRAVVPPMLEAARSVTVALTIVA